jgi:hypothetical protein
LQIQSQHEKSEAKAGHGVTRRDRKKGGKMKKGNYALKMHLFLVHWGL